MRHLPLALLACASALAVGFFTLRATGEGPADFAGLAVIGSVWLILSFALFHLPAVCWLVKRWPGAAGKPGAALFAGLALNAPVVLALNALADLRPGGNELIGRPEAWLFGAMFLVLGLVTGLGYRPGGSPTPRAAQ